ncbi:hypothetical protein GCM10009557_57910 [Virgisporangium ochraceum]|uniref:Uncharacterized protein n=1 Tax=Virgisporangium ochraceum TaxID=65505 RepID=A0A8J4EET6_9ACTN|nr:hypothetical protein [Virgisporangium ochraceum]GIJ71968.1 hypothetical protein Voc01_068850 [Virgisporangium ochraceum]
MRVERTMMATDLSVGSASNRSQPATAAAVTGRSTGAASADMAGRAAVGETGVPRPVEGTERTERTRETQQPQAPTMPGLSTSDRQAIASATGYYITAGGKVTPEGMPPWGFIVKYVEQRQEQRQAGPATGAGVDPVERAAPVLEGEHVDVTV